MEPIVTMDVQLFGHKSLLRNYHRRMLRVDIVSFFIFWFAATYSFVTEPYFIDIVTIPVSFYYLVTQHNTSNELLNNKKRV
tara:strand:- start:650 stop:892 length:243 start_codon:yes stop_codon:yes gene_type:complete